MAHYGAASVFRDIDNIPPGIDYRKYISGALESTDILLAIVGPQWIGRRSDGSARIQEVTDLVRIEVEAALRKDIPVVPVLVGNASMPEPANLPEGLQDFPFRHAVKVDALEDFDDHVKRLIRSLDRLLNNSSTAAETTASVGSLSNSTKTEHAVQAHSVPRESAVASKPAPPQAEQTAETAESNSHRSQSQLVDIAAPSPMEKKGGNQTGLYLFMLLFIAFVGIAIWLSLTK